MIPEASLRRHAFPRRCAFHNQKLIHLMGNLKITIRFCILILVCPRFYYSNDALDFIMSVLRGKKIVNLHFFFDWMVDWLFAVLYQGLLPTDYFVE